MHKENIEIKNALQTMELLKQYDNAKNEDTKNSFLSQLRDVNSVAYTLLTEHSFTPAQMITGLEKAIKLNKFRPKNISLTQLAVSKDVDYINGEFDTFDRKLSQMVKNKEAPTKIRKRFIAGTANIYLLRKQFAYEWIQMLIKHKKLVVAARKANPDTAFDAYNKLLQLLNQDFCKKYDCHINFKIVTDWAQSDVKPRKAGWAKTNGYQQSGYGLHLKNKMSMMKAHKMLDEFHKHPSTCPGAYRKAAVRINITNVKKSHPDKIDFFFTMLKIFVHETHHALDYIHPRKGALGPQIERIDASIYVHPEENIDEYYNSATEISSYTIENTVYKQLQKTRF